MQRRLIRILLRERVLAPCLLVHHVQSPFPLKLATLGSKPIRRNWHRSTILTEEERGPGHFRSGQTLHPKTRLYNDVMNKVVFAGGAMVVSSLEGGTNAGC